ncbi:MAG: pilus assembly protein [Clostridiales bacterium GWF2_38_85]|nr:MAG: pilus assembly protein [Clostridiales bacterium GWF2_38_85]HBL83477.1 Flp family type IVb pilin [Clostridiales bacterium]
MKTLVNFFKDENGQGMVEYGLIIGLIAIVVIAGLVILGPKIRDMFTGIGDKLDASGTVS